MHAVLDWLDAPVAYIDRDVRLRFCNDAFAELAGRPRAELIGLHAIADVGSRFGRQWATELENVLGQPAAADTWSDGRDSEAPPNVRLLPQADEHGVVQGCIVIVDRSVAQPDAADVREREFSALLKALPTPASYVDRDLRFVYMNQAALDERGWKIENVIGHRITDLNDAEELASVAGLFDRALAGERVDYERQAKLANGSLRWIARTLIPRRGSDGAVEGIYIFGSDIHELRSEARRLAAQQAEIRGFLDTLPLPLAYLDATRRFALANQAFCRAEALSESEVVGATPMAVLTSNLFALVGRYFDRAFSGQTIEYEHVGRDARWRRVRLVPHRAQQGEVLGVFVISNDIHEQRLAQLALERREQQVREFSDNIPQPLAYIDANDRVGFVNKAFVTLFGVSRNEVMSAPIADVFSEPVWNEIGSSYARAKSGESINEERLVTCRAGHARWLEMHWWPEFEAGTHAPVVRGVYLLSLDVHDARQARFAYEESIDQMQRAMNSVGIPIGLFGLDERLRYANGTLRGWYGVDDERAVGMHMRDLMGNAVYDARRPQIRQVLAGIEVAFEDESIRPDGQRRWAQVRFIPQRSEKGLISGFFIAMLDVHELKTQQRELQVKQDELRRANWLLSSHLENSPLAVLELDADLNIRRWSERAERLFGWQRDQVLNRSIWDLHLIGAGEVDAITRSFALVLSSRQQRVSALQRMTRHDGSRIWCEWYISALSDETGEIASIFALVQDVNQRVEAEARLQQLAAYDSLTGLPNRSSLQFELAQALDRARRTNGSVAALFIDLDHFKNVNDTLGHRVGDQLLLAVARIMKASVRKGDIVSRMGGDEFMVIVEHPTARVAAQHIANKILVSLNQPIPVEGHMLTIAASVGIAVFPDHGSDANMLLKNADVAMYHAKERGKGRFEFYSDELAREREEQALIEFSLRVAMASNQLSLCYQPRVSLRDGTIEGAEALLRWTHPELGEIAPKKFIRVAEETGLIFELGTWVFRKACTQLREWEMRNLPIRTVSINFSARQLLMRDLVDRISAILREVSCDPRKIEIEITETSMLFDVSTTKRVIASLKRLGLRIAIDDFGTGFSSLSHLQQLDIDALKVDQTFVRDLLVDAGDAAITRAVVALGRGIGLQVIAEGVENAQQLSFLKECGCDLYQGFHFSPAISGRAFEELMRMHLQAVKAVQKPAN